MDSEQVAESGPGDCEFDAFISYRRRDGSRPARWLRQALLTYAPPESLALSKRDLKIYRDEIYGRVTEDFYEQQVLPALLSSRVLLVVASPEAHKPLGDGSRNWVVREIDDYHSAHPDRPIIPVLAPGNEKGLLPPGISERAEWVDLREIGTAMTSWWPSRRRRCREELLKIVAFLHEVQAADMPLLRQEAKRRARAAAWRRLGLAALFLLVLSTVAGLALRMSRLADARRLAAKSSSLLNSAPDQALALGLEATRRSPTQEAQNALRRSLEASHLETSLAFGAPVVAVRFDPRDETLVALSIDGRVLRWNTVSDAVERIFRAGPAEAAYRQLSPRGEVVMAFGSDETIRVWNTRTGAELATLPAPPGAVASAAMNGRLDRLVTGGHDGSVWLWHLGASEEPIAVEGHPDAVSSVSFDHAGERFLTTSRDGSARIWSAENGDELVALLGHTKLVSKGEWDPGDTRVVTGSDDFTAKIWDAARGRELLTLKGHIHILQDVAFNPDGRWVLTASSDRTARLWDASNGDLLDTLEGHENTVHRARFRSDGRWVTTTSADHTVRVWDLWPSTTPTNFPKANQLLANLLGHGDHVFDASFSARGGMLVTASNDGTARLWRPDSGQHERLFETEQAPTYHCNFSGAGDRFVAVSPGLVTLWDVPSGTRLSRLSHSGAVTRAVFSPDGAHLATVTDDGTAALWDASNGTRRFLLATDSPPLFEAAFDNRGEHLLTAGRGDTAIVWDVETGQEKARLPGHTVGIGHVAFDRAGERAVTAGHDKIARVWQATTGELIAQSAPLRLLLQWAEFDAEGSKIVLVSTVDVALWDLVSGEQRTLNGHPSGLLSARFGPRGKRIVAASSSGNATLWTLSRWSLVGRALSQQGEAPYAVFSPDGNYLATGDKDGTVRIWRASDGAETGSVQAGEARNLPGFSGGGKGLACLAFTPDGRRMLAANLAGDVRAFFPHMGPGLLAFAEERLPVTHDLRNLETVDSGSTSE